MNVVRFLFIILLGCGIVVVDRIIGVPDLGYLVHFVHITMWMGLGAVIAATVLSK